MSDAMAADAALRRGPALCVGGACGPEGASAQQGAEERGRRAEEERQQVEDFGSWRRINTGKAGRWWSWVRGLF